MAAFGSAVVPAQAGLGGAGGPPAVSPAPTRWLVEFKRQATARGTPEETTKSQVKFEHYPDGPVSLLRLELPFPDEDTDFEGSPFNPRPGDVSFRVGMKPVPVREIPVASFFELTLPTADPDSLGSGKYQVSAGARAVYLLAAREDEAGARRRSVALQLQQVVSFGGDEARKDVNQTKVEMELRHDWPRGHYAKATAKPVIDWVQDRKSGAVLEMEGGWRVNRPWSVALLVGGLLWGEGTPGTYETRVELKAAYRF